MAQHPGPGGGGKPSKGGGKKGGNFPTYSGDVSGGYYYNNLLHIAQFLMSNGYNRTSAAGQVGAIAGESGGDPEAGGPGNAGFIQWTPGSKAAPVQPIMTGDRQADMDAQLSDILDYNDTNGPTEQLKNFKGSPVEAADFYSQNFERPAVTDSDVRADVANNIYQALAGYKSDASYTQYGGPSVKPGVGKGLGATAADNQNSFADSIARILSFGAVSAGVDVAEGKDPLTSVASAIDTLALPFTKIAEGLDWFFAPNHWIRIFAGIAGTAALGFGVYSMAHVGRGGQVGGSVGGVPVGVDLPSSSLPVAIGATGLGFLGLFVAFHALPSDVKTFPDFVGYLAGEVRNAGSSAGSSSGG